MAKRGAVSADYAWVRALDDDQKHEGVAYEETASSGESPSHPASSGKKRETRSCTKTALSWFEQPGPTTARRVDIDQRWSSDSGLPMSLNIITSRRTSAVCAPTVGAFSAESAEASVSVSQARSLPDQVAVADWRVRQWCIGRSGAESSRRSCCSTSSAALGRRGGVEGGFAPAPPNQSQARALAGLEGRGGAGRSSSCELTATELGESRLNDAPPLAQGDAKYLGGGRLERSAGPRPDPGPPALHPPLELCEKVGGEQVDVSGAAVARARVLRCSAPTPSSGERLRLRGPAAARPDSACCAAWVKEAVSSQRGAIFPGEDRVRQCAGSKRCAPQSWSAGRRPPCCLPPDMLLLRRSSGGVRSRSTGSTGGRQAATLSQYPPTGGPEVRQAPSNTIGVENFMFADN